MYFICICSTNITRAAGSQHPVWNYVVFWGWGKKWMGGGQIARANTQSDEAFKMRK